MTGNDLAQAAASLAGTPFRLHGRDPATGLDCIGLFAAAMARLGYRVDLPTGYRLRNRALPDPDAIARGCGLAPADGPWLPGDVLLAEVGPCQVHLVIAFDATRIVHAHAGLRRTVIAAPPEGWAIARHWRLASATAEN